MSKRQEDIGRRIKYYRELLNMSQSELSQKVGFKNRSSMSAIESGSADIPSERFSSIAKALGVSESTLRYGENDYIVENDKEKIVITKDMLNGLSIDEMSRLLEIYNKCLETRRKLIEKYKGDDKE